MSDDYREKTVRPPQGAADMVCGVGTVRGVGSGRRYRNEACEYWSGALEWG